MPPAVFMLLVNYVDFKVIAIEPLPFPLPIKNLLAYKGACGEDQTTGYFHTVHSSV
jgi:hypothetical protein